MTRGFLYLSIGDKYADRLRVSIASLRKHHAEPIALMAEHVNDPGVMEVLRDVKDVQFVRRGSTPDALYFLLAGEAAVRVGGRELARLAPGNFVAEMSLLTGELTTADVYAIGVVEYMTWPAATLARLRSRSPMLWSKVQSVLGHDMVEKIKRSQPGGRVSGESVAGGASGAGSVAEPGADSPAGSPAGSADSPSPSPSSASSASGPVSGAAGGPVTGVAGSASPG